MTSGTDSHPDKHSAYGSARDLPSYQELAQQIRAFKLLTRLVARGQRKEVVKIEAKMNRLVRIVDAFYELLGSRNWIFHDMLNLDKIEELLAEATDAESAERGLIDLYRDADAMKWWMMRLRNQVGLRERAQQIERAREHYDAGQFDSCTLHLIAIIDGFVNDFDPDARKGLHSRDPDEMVAWDSVVGHHLGLTHAMGTFTKTIKKRVDLEVFEVYRHGIMHGSVVNFDNVVVASKAWNMLFAVADWATATRKAEEPVETQPSFRETLASLARHGTYKRYEREFVPSTLEMSDPDFGFDGVVTLASEFLEAWEHHRWGIVANFKPPNLRRPGTPGQEARETKEVFERFELKDWSIESLTYDQASAAAIRAKATVNDQETALQFRMVFRSPEGNVAIPGQDEGAWSIAVWAPDTYTA